MSIADDITEGLLCAECGVYIDDKADGFAGACGYPRYCRACGGDPETNGAGKVNRRKQKNHNKKKQGGKR
jgi:hypothetical protein